MTKRYVSTHNKRYTRKTRRKQVPAIRSWIRGRFPFTRMDNRAKFKREWKED